MSVEIRSLNNGEGMLRIYRGAVVYADDPVADDLIPEGTFGSELRFVVVDNTAVLRNVTTAEEIRHAADKNIATSRQGLKLIVAVIVNTDVGYGLGRMWEFFAEETGWPTKVTRNMDEAEQWLREKYLEVFGEELSAITDSGEVVPEMGEGAV